MQYLRLIGRLLVQAAVTNDGGEGSAAPGADKMTQAAADILKGCSASKYAPGTFFSIDDYAQPGARFSVEADGVYLICKKQNENREAVDVRTLVCQRLDVIGKTMSADGGQWGRVVVFKDGNGKDVRLSVSMADIYGGGTELSKLLGKAGLVIKDFSSKGGQITVNRYINAFPLEDLPAIKTVGGAGWSDESFSCFVFNGRVIRAANGDIAELASDAKAPKIQTKGTLTEWKEWFSGISKHSQRLSFAVMVALAAPMLPIIGDMSRLFNFYGESSTGKSSAVKAAATVWGTYGEWVQTWDVTKNAPAAFAKSFSSLPLIFDELKVAGATLTDISYILSSGKERGRCDRLGNPIIGRTWNLFILSTGEDALPAMKKRNLKGKAAEVATGELVRFIDIPAIANPQRDEFGIFESFPDDIAQLTGDPGVLARKAWIDSYLARPKVYGTAGAAFLEGLEKDVAGDVDAFNTAAWARINEFSAAFDVSQVTTARVLTAFGIVALAGELAASYGVLPWAPGKASEIARNMFTAWKSSASTIEEREDNFVDAVRNDTKRCANAYVHYDENGRNKGLTNAQSTYGALFTRQTDNGTETVLGVYAPKEFSDLLDRQGDGLTAPEAAKILKKKNRLICNNDKKHPFDYRAPRRKGVLPLGLLQGLRYKVVLISDDREVAVRMLKAVELLPHGDLGGQS